MLQGYPRLYLIKLRYKGGYMRYPYPSSAFVWKPWGPTHDPLASYGSALRLCRVTVRYNPQLWGEDIWETAIQAPSASYVCQSCGASPGAIDLS